MSVPPARAGAPPTVSQAAVSYAVRLEQTGTPGKFWALEVRGDQHLTTFGRLGTTGQVRLASFPDEARARADAEKRTAAKRKDGYR